MKALVIQHSLDTGIGLVGPILRDLHGFELLTVDAKTVNFDDIDPASADLFVLLGSPNGVYETQIPWIAAELAFTKRLIASAKPIIGICFGGQMLAAAHGAKVKPMGYRDAGWLANDDAVDSTWAGPWFRWHGDTFALPDGAVKLASAGEVMQGFQKGNTVGMQFHPEVTVEIMQGWVEIAGESLVSIGVDSAQLLDNAPTMVKEVQPRVESLISDVLARCLG
jgi:GMP synthase (glutamine-hydrolysing)